MAEIQQRMGEPFDINSFAAAVNLSPSRFSHLFRAETGLSPLRYVRNQRMERARVLLERTFLNVKEVMARVGCNDPSHFARDFRRYHGRPPREWRAAVGGARHEPFLESPFEAADQPSTDARGQESPTDSRRRQRTRGP
jgi:AraC family transcriptional regulator of arabinose operon